MNFFSNVAELKNVDRDETRLCLVPVSQTLPALDAITTKESVITVQMTVAHEHDAKPIGFQNLYKSSSPEFLSKERERYHVFLTDTKVRAKSLRRQTLVDQQLTTMNIQLCSAYIDKYIEFGNLDLIISGERVDELETERVSSYWLYAINIHWQSCRIGPMSRKWIQEIKIVALVPLRKHFDAEVLFLNRVRVLPMVPVREHDEKMYSKRGRTARLEHDSERKGYGLL